MTDRQRATAAELAFVSQPILPAACATMAWWGNLPPEAKSLPISFDRGGKVRFYQLSLSEYGVPDRRVLGGRVIDVGEMVLKEDVHLYDLPSGTRYSFAKGRFQVEKADFDVPDWAYVDTHHRPIDEILPHLRAEIVGSLDRRLAQLRDCAR